MSSQSDGLGMAALDQKGRDLRGNVAYDVARVLANIGGNENAIAQDLDSFRLFGFLSARHKHSHAKRGRDRSPPAPVRSSS